MKKIMMIALTALATTGFAQMKDGKYIVDYKGSVVSWRGENLTGGGHDGTVAISSGNVVVMRNSIASGKFKINMNDMTCTDIKDPGTNSKLINHLKAEDFFNTAQYPDASFEISNCWVVDHRQVFIGDHRATSIPTLFPNDVNRRDIKGIGSSYN